jgi:hypothetical protein
MCVCMSVCMRVCTSACLRVSAYLCRVRVSASVSVSVCMHAYKSYASVSIKNKLISVSRLQIKNESDKYFLTSIKETMCAVSDSKSFNSQSL